MIGYRAGKGKYEGMTGSLEVRSVSLQPVCSMLTPRWLTWIVFVPLP